jgi:hypothetical protein
MNHGMTRGEERQEYVPAKEFAISRRQIRTCPTLGAEHHLRSRLRLLLLQMSLQATLGRKRGLGGLVAPSVSFF